MTDMGVPCHKQGPVEGAFRKFGNDFAPLLVAGDFGAVIARAGVGKTAFLVQTGIHAMLNGRNLLHISLEDPVSKVNLWYEQVLRSLEKESGEIESIIARRFIMTFKVDTFTVPKLAERYNDLLTQNIFQAHVLIVDGLPFDDGMAARLLEFKEFVAQHALSAWFSIRIHRDDPVNDQGLTRQAADVADMFDHMLILSPSKDQIMIKTVIKEGGNAGDAGIMRLDPETFLIA